MTLKFIYRTANNDSDNNNNKTSKNKKGILLNKMFFFVFPFVCRCKVVGILRRDPLFYVLLKGF